MNKIKKIIRILLDRKFRFYFLTSCGFYNYWSDEKFLKRKYKLILGHSLNLKNPTLFSEKLQWLKLHDRKPIYTTMVDKYEAKKYVANIIGEQYIIPTLGVWDKFEDIDFNKLPNQFVLKCTHDSGGLVICRDKRKFDVKATKKKINRSLKRNYFWQGREWPYKNVKPRVIAEKYMEDAQSGELKDYKFFCFNGMPKFMYISNDRGMIPHTDFFDMNKASLSFRLKDPPSPRKPSIPKQFEKMKNLAILLSKDIPCVRVDFYIVAEKIYFGELTFFHNGGFTKFTPCEWDKTIGSWLELPKIK